MLKDVYKGRMKPGKFPVCLRILEVDMPSKTYAVIVYFTLSFLYYEKEKITIKRISELSGVSARHVSRMMRVLADYGFIDYPDPKERDENGYIYLIRCVDRYKIGKSNDPISRFRKLSAQAAYRLEILKVVRVRSMTKSETELHRRYEAKRAQGEWFNLDPSDVDEILAMGDDE